MWHNVSSDVEVRVTPFVSRQIGRELATHLGEIGYPQRTRAQRTRLWLRTRAGVQYRTAIEGVVDLA